MKAKLSNKQCLIHKTIIEAGVCAWANFNSFLNFWCLSIFFNHFQGQSLKMLCKPNLEMLTEAQIDNDCFCGFRVSSLYWKNRNGRSPEYGTFKLTLVLRWQSKHFGELIWMTNTTGDPNETYMYVLHLSCFWFTVRMNWSGIGKLRICFPWGGKRVGGRLHQIHRKTYEFFGVDKI